MSNFQNNIVKNYCQVFNIKIRPSKNYHTDFLYGSDNRLVGLCKKNDKYIFINGIRYKKTDLALCIIEGVEL